MLAQPASIHLIMRHIFFIISLIIALPLAMGLSYDNVFAWNLLPVFAVLFIIGCHDAFFSKHNIIRNYPIIGHLRFILLGISPQIHQYFVEGPEGGKPYNWETRRIVYERAHKSLDTLPFGTRKDVLGNGFTYAHHSLSPKVVPESEARILFGNKQCKQPYSASRLNISAMSFGAISPNAIRALNRGAKSGEFAHNTGEGGLSKYHLESGGDIIWQIGTAYFGCRTENGAFDPHLFEQQARLEAVKMIEIKLSQGAKPSHGGILPGAKVNREIAETRKVPQGQDAISPPTHSEFSTPLEMMDFITRLRKLSGGKPVGFKLCIGKYKEFLSICKAMLKTGIYPDFITVDGAEGGTGAAPLEFSNNLGTPIDEALPFVHNCLMGVGLRKHIRVIASGKVATGFDMVEKIALGADTCNAARAMMFALGCVQSLKCNTNECPTGITTQDPKRYQAVVVKEKYKHVANYHKATIHSFRELCGAMGVADPDDLTAELIFRRVSQEKIMHMAEIYPQVSEGQFLKKGKIPEAYKAYWEAASEEAF